MTIQRYSVKPWDIRRADMVRDDAGEFVSYDDHLSACTAPKVKPLVWESSAYCQIARSGGMWYHLECTHGHYSCGVQSAEDFKVCYRGSAEGKAKAAANAYHERRILDALE
jgi:hypothetical protein